MSVQGHCDAPFGKVKELFQGFIDSGDELGASITVNINGKDVIDLWGGYKDQERTEPWTQDTLVNVWSTTKTVSSLVTLILADRGLLNVNDKVSKYWPEFGTNGKEDVEVRHFLSHTSGVSGWAEPITAEEIMDLSNASAKLAAQAPFWKPGTASGYHSISMGHLLQKVIEGASGKTLSQVLREEVTEPLKADFHIGCPESEWGRVSKVVPPPPADFSQIDPESIAIKTLGNPPMDARVSYSDAWKRAELGAVNGHGNSHSVCKMLSAITLGGEVDGKRILSQKTIDLIWNEQSNGPDLVIGLPLRFGTGYCIGTDSIDWIPKGRVCFWGGWGGSIIIMDVDRKVTFAFVMNKMEQGTLGNARTAAYGKAFYEALMGQSTAGT